MNNERRRKIRTILSTLSDCADEVDTLKDAEEEAMDGVPEALQDTDRYSVMENAVDCLSDAGDAIGEAIQYLEDAIG